MKISVLIKRSQWYLQLIRDEGLVPSQEEEQRRSNVIRKLREVIAVNPTFIMESGEHFDVF